MGRERALHARWTWAADLPKAFAAVLARERLGLEMSGLPILLVGSAATVRWLRVLDRLDRQHSGRVSPGPGLSIVERHLAVAMGNVRQPGRASWQTVGGKESRDEG